MRPLSYPLAAAALLAGSLLLPACGSKQAHMDTSTPTSTLGTDSAATAAGGVPDSASQPTPGPASPGGSGSKMP